MDTGAPRLQRLWLDIWAYPTRAVALREGAKLALACGLDEDEHAVALYRASKYAQLLEHYEQTRSETHLLRVHQPSCRMNPDRPRRESTGRCKR